MSAPTERVGGHSVLVIAVPELNEWIRERTAFYDPTFLSDDPGFVNAHITLLGPWISDPDDAELRTVAEIAKSTPSFAFTLEEIATFPDGIVYLAPAPAAPFTDLTARLARAFPEHPPYAGAFASVVPHLTLDQVGAEVSVESVRTSLGALVPATVRSTHIDLQWWENDRCRRLRSWPLSG